jgi:hypothetical protein
MTVASRNEPRVFEASLPGSELMRFVKPGHAALFSVRDNGTVWITAPGDKQWRQFAKRREDLTYEQWRARKLEHFETLPTWARNVRKLPSNATLKRWAYDTVCKSVTGHTVEHDGHGPDGAPSWLMALGYI